MTKATIAVSPLRRRMIDDMSLRNLSPATQRSYLHAVTKFSRYYGRSPDCLGLEDVRAFQVHLVSQGSKRCFQGTSVHGMSSPTRDAG